MSRPATRSKNKRNRNSENGGATSMILRQIHSTGCITDEDINTLYMIWKPVCQGCRVNTKDNPNCFCGLFPASGGSRKSGLWQKTSEIVASLGPDPCADIRAPDDSPAGLTNLGATCYANSILQCLYMNTYFRQGVFSTEAEILKQYPVLDQLGRLFAQLHASKKACIDSAPFIKTLELDNGIQQDCHEFLTLLLSLLERCLCQSKVSKARTVVQDLFRGSVSHVTKCLQCGKDSESSSKMEDFYFLELNVKGLKSLDESLNDYLSVEDLCGDNPYFCESCGVRVNATRSIKLRSLPDVLNFQLKRCVFHPKTTMKKKITSAFAFPGELDMGRRLFEPEESVFGYDLSAVLIHKGTAVNSGHYVAHIKDEFSGQWWEFDDETVTNLGLHPFGEGSSSSISSDASAAKLPRSEPSNAVGNGNIVNVDPPTSSEIRMNGEVQTFSSSDAYMLMYKLRSAKTTGKEYVRGVENMKTESDICIPSHLYEEIKELNTSYLDACQQYKVNKEQLLKCITERRKEVQYVISEAPVSSIEDPYFWISSEWLRQWADNINPVGIDNTPIQCEHGKVSVSKVSGIKRISTGAWALLLSKYNGGPVLSNKDYCTDCLLTGASTVVSADSYRDQRTVMREVAEAALAGRVQDGTLYYVSKTWLQQWLRRKNVDAPCEADAGPTVAIRCPHGEILPEVAVGAKRVLVPENLWLFFYEIAKQLKPEDTLSCLPFPVDSESCDECSIELTEVSSLEDALRVGKLKQRQNHEKLALGKSIPLSMECKYYLIPSSWLSLWRSYINISGKNASSTDKPEVLNDVINSLKCEKHSRLLERPLDLIWKRGVILQRPSATDGGLTAVTEDDWKLFCEEWGGVQENGISATIEYVNVNGVINNLEHDSLSGPHICVNEDANGDSSCSQPVLKPCIEICEDCIGERESCELVQKLNYCNENICVCFVRGKEPPISILEASATSFEPDRRTSKRSRKTTFGNSVNLKVSGSTTIYQVKMMIWESFEVVRENQVLHKGSRVLDNESSSLADMNIFPGDVLWVTDSEIHEYRDIADEISDQKMEVHQAEEGFRGSLLTSNNSSQVV